MSAFGSGWWPYFYILIAGFVATDFWRFLGVFLSVRINEGAEILLWVRAVSTALVAGLVARLIVFPVGDLATTELTMRLGAVAVGLVVFFAFRRSMLAGIIAGEIALLVGMWLL